eukprot:748888-Amphidinium_carterae.1
MDICVLMVYTSINSIGDGCSPQSHHLERLYSASASWGAGSTALELRWGVLSKARKLAAMPPNYEHGQ